MSAISQLDESELLCLHSSIAIVSTRGFNHCYQTLRILFNINHLLYKYAVIKLKGLTFLIVIQSRKQM